jgi:ATP-dependent helicase HepA
MQDVRPNSDYLFPKNRADLERKRWRAQWIWRVAMFVKVRGLEQLGFAKTIDRAGSAVSIEYFDSPHDKGRILREVRADAIKVLPLPKETRIYFEDGAYWRVGRILDGEGDEVLVQFPNTDIRKLSARDIFVRWNRPIADPTPYLAKFINETPLFADTRARFLQSYTIQRAAAKGMSALLSSAIELIPHQIEVVRRVLHDPIQRYLLADEVGLGKTIEAGVLIRQYVLDNPVHHRVLLIVPDSLVDQWRRELSHRFLLRNYLDDSIRVHGFTEQTRISQAVGNVGMLVIDEAHHLAHDRSDNLELYELVRTAARGAERLLLLSATPALHNERGFLRMLHLLDPVIFSLEDESAFKKKIEHRQALAENTAALVPENALQLDWILDDLIQRLPGDALLQDLVNKVRTVLATFPAADDVDLISVLRVLQTHLSETYRLHRRILRNRRQDVQGLTPERKGLTVWEYDSFLETRVQKAIEDWRGEAAYAFYGKEHSTSAESVAKFYADLMVTQLGRTRLLDLLNARIQHIRARSSGSFADERRLLDVMIERVRLAEQDDARLQRLLEGLQTLPKLCKTIIFTTDEETADAIADHLRRNMRVPIDRHDPTVPEDDEVAEWTKFLTDSSHNILVCDIRAEEGLNMQGGDKTVVHFDLPLSPNRVEQRMGRVDRFGSGAAVESFALLARDSETDRLWISVLRDGFQVFTRSIAALQYLVEEILRRLEMELFSKGSGAFSDLAVSLSGQEGTVAKEMRKISQQDVLDSLARLDGDGFSELEEVDDDWRKIQKDFDGWIERTLQFRKVLLQQDNLIVQGDSIFRYEYSTDTTLLPLSIVLDELLDAIDFEASGTRARNRVPSHSYSCRRQTALNRGTRVLRFGDEFVRGAKEFTERDDRGRTFAFWRYLPGYKAHEDADLFFRFDFVVEVNIRPAFEIYKGSGKLPPASARAALIRQGDSVFPPMFDRLWLDSDLRQVDQSVIDTCLRMDYNRSIDSRGRFDRNLNPTRWGKLEKLNLSVLHDWESRCLKASETARTILRDSSSLQMKLGQALRRSKESDDIYFAQIAARLEYQTGTSLQEREQLELERTARGAFMKGIQEPIVRFDTIGAIFVSGTQLS